MEKVNDYFVVYRNELPSYEEFYFNVMKQNIACLFDAELTSNWKSRKEWTRNGMVDLAYLQRYASLIVPVYNCSEKYFNSNPKNEMEFGEYLKYWQSLNDENISESSKQILYLKDWHFFQDMSDSSHYEIPKYFQSDYLNEYCLNNSKTDYRFVYMGPASSSTPLHTDVFGSFSWSANISGRKKWVMIPAGKVSLFKSCFTELPHDLYSLPDYQEMMDRVEAFEIIQNEGEVLFVPSGFMHQVENLCDTISINHNWFNACNIDVICDNILQANAEVQQEINDLKTTMNGDEWIEICEKLMIMHFGLNLANFIEIIEYITSRLESDIASTNNDFSTVEDTEAIRQVLTKANNQSEFIFLQTKIDGLLKRVIKIKSQLIKD